MAAQGVEERLEAAVDRAAEDTPLDVHLGDPGRALDLLQRRRTHERDLDPLHLKLLGHHDRG
jgi:hypothetical protein